MFSSDASSRSPRYKCTQERFLDGSRAEKDIVVQVTHAAMASAFRRSLVANAVDTGPTGPFGKRAEGSNANSHLVAPNGKLTLVLMELRDPTNLEERGSLRS